MRRAVLASLVLAAACSTPVDDPPVARAGIDRLVAAGDDVALVGDADREAEYFVWTVVASPGPHVLAGNTGARALFTPSVPGTYVLSLEVFAGASRSEPDYVAVTAIDCDRDGDGSRALGRICRGGDCDDFDPAISPRAEDVCEDGIDQDCNGYDEQCCPRDNDGDGYVTVLCPDGTDCNDTDERVNPGVLDVCNGVDDDCNGADDGRDCPDDLPCVDGACGCEPRLETCDDGIDQDCDGADLLSDEDGDAHAKLVCGGDDCDDTNNKVFRGATELCGNGVDEDCDGVDVAADADGDGYPVRVSAGDAHLICPGGNDCNDADPAVHPGAPDLCPDGIDQDCDGHDAVFDSDHDGYIATACGGLDCDDADPWVKPGAIESCNGTDDDCNGAVDDLPPSPCGPAAGSFPLQADGTVGEWLVLGPVLLNQACWEEATRFPEGEAAVDPAPQDGAFARRWEPYRGHGVVDLAYLRTYTGADARSAAYLFTRLAVPAPAHYLLQLEASESAALWIDGVRQSFPASAIACNAAGVESAVVYLSAGLHRVLVRTGTNGGPWTVKLKVLTPETAAPGPDRIATELRVDNGTGSSFGSCVPGTLVCDPILGRSVCVDFVGPSPETCATPDDDDCDGVAPEPDEDVDGVPAPGCALPDYAGRPDCNDHHRQIGPGQDERCDAENADENCDGAANDLGPASCGSGPTTFVTSTGAIGSWLVLGPIDTPGLPDGLARLDRRDLTAVLGGAPQATARAFPGQVVGPFAWTPLDVPADRADGWVSLPEALPGRDFDRTTTLALVTLWIPEVADYRFDIAAGGALQVVLDGVPIREIPQTTTRVVTVATAHLDAGPHRLLLELTSLASTTPGFGVLVSRATGPSPGVGLDLGRGVLRGACVPGVRTCGPGGWSGCGGAISAVPEKCNRLDDDCDGVLPASERDADGDGRTGCEGDCDDLRAEVGPGGVELCDGRDNDCDGFTDVGPGGQPLGGDQLCGVAGAVCEPIRTACPASLARCMVLGACADDQACVVRYGTGWRCAGGDRCFRCGPP